MLAVVGSSRTPGAHTTSFAVLQGASPGCCWLWDLCLFMVCNGNCPVNWKKRIKSLFSIVSASACSLPLCQSPPLWQPEPGLVAPGAFRVPQVTVQPPEPLCPWGASGAGTCSWALLRCHGEAHGASCTNFPFPFSFACPSPTFCCSAAGPGQG